MNIEIHTKRVFKIQLSCIAILFLLNAIALLAKYGFNDDHLMGFSELVYLNAENNIPTFFSSLFIFICAITLLLIALYYKKNNLSFAFHWMALAVIFLFLALDEAASLHEHLIVPLRHGLNATGVFYFAWVIPALIMLPLLFFAYYKFLLDLPRQTAILCLISGGVYICGAVGMEMVGGYIRYINNETPGTMSLLYSLITTLEESLEMLGMALFLYTLLSFLSIKVKQLNIKISL